MKFLVRKFVRTFNESGKGGRCHIDTWPSQGIQDVKLTSGSMTVATVGDTQLHSVYKIGISENYIEISGIARESDKPVPYTFRLSPVGERSRCQQTPKTKQKNYRKR